MIRFILVACLIFPISVFAETYRPDLKVGMNFPDVLKAWGPALDKSEFETRREELWKYPFGEVRFRQGLVSRWNSETVVARNATPVSMKPHKLKPEGSDGAGHTRETEALLGEILKEIPSGSPDSGSSFSPVNPIPGGMSPDPRGLQKPPDID